MYKEMPQFIPPPVDAALWRYISFTKFVSLLAKNALFFVRADRLDDRFEGTLGLRTSHRASQSMESLNLLSSYFNFVISLKR